MPYQLREFHILLNSSSKNQNQKLHSFQTSDSFPDIYVFKQRSVHIGVKFRGIKTKKYGFKINSVQIKIDRQALYQKFGEIAQDCSMDSHFSFYQNWKKYEVDFKYKLLKPSIFHDHQTIQRLKTKEIQKAQWKNDNPHYKEQIHMKYHSFESQLQHLNIQLTEKIRNYFCQKYPLKTQLYQDNFITEWLKEQNPIKELFLIYKNKLKIYTWQAGKLLVQSFSGKTFQIKNQKCIPHKLKLLLFETFSEEQKDKQLIQSKINPTIIEKIIKQEQNSFDLECIYNISNHEQNLVQIHKKGGKFKQNTSYPQLIQDIYTLF